MTLLPGDVLWKDGGAREEEEIGPAGGTAAANESKAEGDIEQEKDRVTIG